MCISPLGQEAIGGQQNNMISVSTFIDRKDDTAGLTVKLEVQTAKCMWINADGLVYSNLMKRPRKTRKGKKKLSIYPCIGP